jgi:hypothetical protein
MTSWVQSGVPCICVEEEWHDFFSDDEVQGPVAGERYVVADHQMIDGALFLKVLGDDHWSEADAFLPVADLDRDVELFHSILTGSSAPIRSTERA